MLVDSGEIIPHSKTSESDIVSTETVQRTVHFWICHISEYSANLHSSMEKTLQRKKQKNESERRRVDAMISHLSKKRLQQF